MGKGRVKLGKLGKPAKSAKPVDNFVVIESNGIVDSSHRLTLPEIRFITYMLGNIYRTEGVVENQEYVIRVEEYAEFFDIEWHSAYEQITKAVNLLTTRALHVSEQLYNPKASPKARRIIHWVHSIKYNTDYANAVLIWHSDLIPLLNNLGRENPYSSYYLRNIRKLESLNSIRLYRVLNRHKHTGKVILTLEELRRLLGLLDTEYLDWIDFARWVLKPSIADINRETELKVTLNTLRVGRKVGKLEFIIDNLDNNYEKSKLEQAKMVE